MLQSSYKLQATAAKLRSLRVQRAIKRCERIKICQETIVQRSFVINSLTAIGAHERQLFNELSGTVVSRQIFIRSQSLIAR